MLMQIAKERLLELFIVFASLALFCVFKRSVAAVSRIRFIVVIRIVIVIVTLVVFGSNIPSVVPTVFAERLAFARQ
ncbi:MAG: hypothetical protein ACKVIW_11105, partial [bacterium]